MTESDKTTNIDPKNDKPTKPTAGQLGSTLIDKFPQWFVVLLGLTYGTGFLTVFCFANYFGIRGAAVEGLKAKYIHVGILCLQFPFSVGVVVLVTIFMLRTSSEPRDKNAATPVPPETPDGKTRRREEKRKMLEASAMSVFCLIMLSFFYLLSTFARPGHFASHELGIAVFFLTILVGALVMAWQRGLYFAGWRFKRDFLDLWSVEIRWMLIVGLLVETLVVFASLREVLWEMLRLGGYMYFLLIVLIGEIIWRLRGRYDSDKGAGLFLPYAVMGLTICAALFYLAVLTFAYRVYPYIPVSKGGGDYTDEPMCILRFDDKYQKSIPSEIIDATQTNVLRSKPLMIIDEADNKLFVAETNATNNPVEWRKPGHQNKPSIFTLRREIVTSIQYQP